MVKYSGWLNLYKPQGVSSHQALRPIKKLFAGCRVGHGGTLDPFACGVLPVAIGEATKTVDYVMHGEKEYLFTLAWGESTDTQDLTGRVVESSQKIPSRDEIIEALPQFIGRIQQIPPMYSAISVGGKRAYQLARSGKDPELKPREVEVFSLELLGHDVEKKQSSLRMRSGKGVYVRSIVRDLAATLGACAHTIFLERTGCGKFLVENSQKLSMMEDLLDKGDDFPPIEQLLMPILQVLDDILVCEVSEEQVVDLSHGKRVEFSLPDLPDEVRDYRDIRFAVANGRPIAICKVEGNGFLKPMRGFNL